MPTALVRVMVAMVAMILVVAAISVASRPALEAKGAPRLRAAG